MKRSPESDASTASKPDAAADPPVTSPVGVARGQAPVPIDPVLPPDERAEVALFMIPPSAARGGGIVDVHDARRLHFDSLDTLSAEAAAHLKLSDGWFSPAPSRQAPPSAPVPPTPVPTPSAERADVGVTLNQAVAAALDLPQAPPAEIGAPSAAVSSTETDLQTRFEDLQRQSEEPVAPLSADSDGAPSALEAFPAESLHHDLAPEQTGSELDDFPSESEGAMPPAASPSPTVEAETIAVAAAAAAAPDDLAASHPWADPLAQPAAELAAPIAGEADVAPPPVPPPTTAAVAAVSATPAPPRLSPWFALPESDMPLEWDRELEAFTSSSEGPGTDGPVPPRPWTDVSLRDDVAGRAATNRPAPVAAVPAGHHDPAANVVPAALLADGAARTPHPSPRSRFAAVAVAAVVSGVVAGGLYWRSTQETPAEPGTDVQAALVQPPAAVSSPGDQSTGRPPAPALEAQETVGTGAQTETARATPAPTPRNDSGSAAAPVAAAPGAPDTTERSGSGMAGNRARMGERPSTLAARSLPPPPPGASPNSVTAPTNAGVNAPAAPALGSENITAGVRLPSGPATPPPGPSPDASPGTAAPREADSTAVASAGRAPNAPPVPSATDSPAPPTTIIPPAEAPRTEARASTPAEAAPVRNPPPTDTAAANSPTAGGGATEASADDAIADALKRLQVAYERRDARLAKAIWPTVDERALARAFGGLRSQSVTFDNCHLTVSGPAGEVECRGVTTYVPLVGSQDPRRESRQWKFRVEKGDEGWLITSAAAR